MRQTTRWVASVVVLLLVVTLLQAQGRNPPPPAPLFSFAVQALPVTKQDDTTYNFPMTGSFSGTSGAVTVKFRVTQLKTNQTDPVLGGVVTLSEGNGITYTDVPKTQGTVAGVSTDPAWKANFSYTLSADLYLDGNKFYTAKYTDGTPNFPVPAK